MMFSIALVGADGIKFSQGAHCKGVSWQRFHAMYVCHIGISLRLQLVLAAQTWARVAAVVAIVQHLRRSQAYRFTHTCMLARGDV